MEGTKAQHTPGPWRLSPSNDLRECPGVYVGVSGARWAYLADVVVRVKDVNGVPHDSPVGEANARLIAAAPDLLAALEGLTVLERTQSGGIVVGPQGWERARAAIARARGEAEGGAR